MKLLFDLAPVLLFFAVFKLGGAYPQQADALAGQWLGALIQGGAVPEGLAPILLATAVAILASVVQVTFLLARGRRVDTVLWIGLAVIVVFGGATIWLHDETFIKWKPTILYALFGAILAVGRLAGRNLLRSLLARQLALPDAAWTQLLWAWVGFFGAMATLNLAVAYSFSTEVWVNFKLFGLLGLTLAFTLGIGLWMARHMKEAADG